MSIRDRKTLASNEAIFSKSTSSSCVTSENSYKSLSPIAFNPAELSAFASIDSFIAVPPSTIADTAVNLITTSIVPAQFTLNLVVGQTYTFSLRGTGPTAIPDPFLALITDSDRDGTFGDAEDVVIIDDDGGDGLNSLITYTASYSGAHRFFVGAAGSGEGGQWTFTRVIQDGADESDSFAAATQLTLGNLYYGFIDSVPPAPAGNPYGPTFGEVDTFKITLEAGKAYIIEASGGADYLSDFRALPPGEVDTYMVIYGPDGSIIQNDDASFANGDIGSALAFVAPATGTYFVDLFAYAPQTGGYSIVATEVDLTVLDPLDAINWFSADNIDVGPGNVVKVYFATPGESFGELADNGTDPLPSFGWNAFEKQQVMQALTEYSKIIGVTYVETTNAAEAEFRLITTTSNNYGAYFYPQDPDFGDAQGIGVFNVDSGGWNFDEQQSLLQGGFAFAVILHEFGHAHGLAHPHDTGGGSEVLAGVFGPFDSYGFYDLNQGVYTVMSYNDAWPLHPDGPSPFTVDGVDNGWSGTLSAFDIAVLQQRYGVHAFATGNDVYVLEGDQEVGTYYKTIWDTGGTDEIRYTGMDDVRIDLTAATLDYSPTGGGVVSFVDGIKGGYTIANGVVIENATGDFGDDVLIGNAAANVLTGNNGDDVLMGRAGNDTLNGGNHKDTLDGGEGSDTLNGGNQEDKLDGGAGNDALNGGNAKDLLNGGAGDDVLTGSEGKDVFAFAETGYADRILDFVRGDDKIDLSAIDAVLGGGDNAFSFIGAAAFSGVAGQLRAFNDGGNLFVAGDVDGNGVADFTIQTNILIIATDLVL